MSVSIIENWSNISAEVTGVTASQDLSGFMEVEMLVDSVTPANDYPSLLDDTVGTHLIVHFPADLVESSRIEAANSPATDSVNDFRGTGLIFIAPLWYTGQTTKPIIRKIKQESRGFLINFLELKYLLKNRVCFYAVTRALSR